MRSENVFGIFRSNSLKKKLSFERRYVSRSQINSIIFTSFINSSIVVIIIYTYESLKYRRNICFFKRIEINLVQDVYIVTIEL